MLQLLKTLVAIFCQVSTSADASSSDEIESGFVNKSFKPGLPSNNFNASSSVISTVSPF